MISDNILMKEMEILLNVQKLAKVELHCHLDGSLSLSLIRKLAQLANLSLPEEDSDLRQLVSVDGKVDSLMTYLKKFDVIRPLLQTSEALELAAYDVVQQAAMDNILYIEIRFAPELSTDRGLTVLEAVEAVLAGLELAQKDFHIMAKLLVCGLKQTNPSQTKEIFSAIADLAPKGLVGFDFAGNVSNIKPPNWSSLITSKLSLFSIDRGGGKNHNQYR